MSTWRKVQGYNPTSKGIVIGWLIGPQVDAKIRAALPGWAIAFTAESETSVTSADLQAARKAVGAPFNAPVILVGWSAGCQAVRACLVSKIVDPWGVACFDGTAGNVPPADWQVSIWADYMTRARAGLCRGVFTSTMMTYTKDIPAGEPGRAWPTSWILARALGMTDGDLKPGAPIDDGNLYVEAFASASIDKSAHIAQINDIAPRLLAKFADGPGTPVPVTGPPVPPSDPDLNWRDPNASKGERLARWADAEMNLWEKSGWEETPPGSNDNDRIRQYAGLDYRRRGTGVAMRGLRNVRWCAEAACYGVSSILLTGEAQPLPYRVSGIEIQQDAIENRIFDIDPRNAKRGDIAILKLPGVPDWGRHVAIVVGVSDGGLLLKSGNENNAWGASVIVFADASTFLGSISIG